MSRRARLLPGAAAVAALGAGLFAFRLPAADVPAPQAGPHAGPAPAAAGYDWQLPNDAWKTPFKDEQPILFVTRAQDARAWDALPAFWNEATEQAVDPTTGRAVSRKAVKVKVPLGLNQPPPVPAENPMTVAKFALGKRLYFDHVLSSDGTVSCASCHDPRKGFTDRLPFSLGIKNLRGGMSAPTVFNSAYNTFQFWDGRAASLEEQAQGPVMNPVEMFGGDGHAWNKLVGRLRERPRYVSQFKAVFGTLPTRDATAKAIACYERLVLSGDSVHDRADLAMRRRAEEDEGGKAEVTAHDYEAVLRAAVASRDVPALEALGLDPARDAARVPAVAEALGRGRALFFGKARCNGCHVGENFTDNAFHNLGVGVKEGNLPPEALGRFAALPTGAKDPALAGAFKTPTLRHLLDTAPYLHDGGEATLEQVVDFYDRGGNANEFLDPKMRDFDAEKAYTLSRQDGTPYKGPAVQLFGPGKKPVVPLKLNLTPGEKKDLVLFLKALQGDPAPPVVADRALMPAGFEK